MGESSLKGEEQKEENAFAFNSERLKLTKEDKVRRTAEYRLIAQEGKKYRTPHFIIRMLRNQLSITRLGITVGRKTGKACIRNQIKRRLKEYFRLNRGKLPKATDLVFIALPGAAFLDTKQLSWELDQFFESQHSIWPDIP